MNYKENAIINRDIFFSISYLHGGNSYSAHLPPIANTIFKISFFLRQNRLVVLFERNTTDLASYLVIISNCQPNPIVKESSIRFNKDQKTNEIVLNEASNYIISSLYKINIKMKPKRFNVPHYLNNNNKNKNENSFKKQTKVSDYYIETTEDHLGLTNQGATCYLNSILQVLFHLKKFRKLIYDERVEQNESNFIFRLQLLFRDLQLRASRRSTRHLTDSLGWNKDEVHTSQDASEFFKFLFESIFKGHSIVSLFEGEFNATVTNYLSDIPRYSKEKFIQILLKVEGFGSLIDSLKSFFFPFSFMDNQGMNGSIESIKQISIFKLPPVLSFVLKRFWFNEGTQQYEKLNSIMTFPNILNLNEVGIQTHDSNYQLYAIIAHIGTLNAGHYVSFINPDLKGTWYEFNDNKVFRQTAETTFNLCYGRNRMNAYMLFYINLSKKDELFNNSLLNIPLNIQRYKYIVQKKPEIQIFMNNEEGIIKNLKKLKHSFLNMDVRKTLFFNQNASFSEIYKSVASLWNKEPNSIRIWDIKNDSLIRIFRRDEKLKISENHSWFVQEIHESEELLVDENHFIAFISFYIPESQQKIFYLGSHQFCIYDLISCIEKVVSKKFMNGTFSLISYAFTNNNIIPLTNTSIPFIQLALCYNGLFLIVQSKPENIVLFDSFSIDLTKQIEKDDQIECEIEYSDIEEVNFDFVDSYFNYRFNQVIVYLYHFINNENPFIKLTVLKGCSSSYLKNLIAFNAGFDYNENEDSILLFNKSNLNKLLDEESLYYILQKGNNTENLCFLIYKGFNDFYKSNQMKIDIIYNSKTISFYIAKNEPKKMIQQHLIDNNIIPSDKFLRFYLVCQSKIVSILNDDDVISDPNWVLHIEEIPKYQLEEDILILKVNQSFKDGNDLVCFGVPFLIGIKFDELCIDAKQRICSLIGCQMNKFSILVQNNLNQSDDYRMLMNNENILDAIDGNNEIFAFFSS